MYLGFDNMDFVPGEYPGIDTDMRTMTDGVADNKQTGAAVPQTVTEKKKFPWWLVIAAAVGIYLETKG